MKRFAATWDRGGFRTASHRIGRLGGHRLRSLNKLGRPSPEGPREEYSDVLLELEAITLKR